MQFVDFFVRGSSSYVVTEWKKFYEPRVVNCSDTRQYEGIDSSELKIDSVKKLYEVTVISKSFLASMTLTFNPTGTKAQREIWESYAKRCGIILAVSFSCLAGAGLGLLYSAVKGYSVKRGLFLTLFFTVLSAGILQRIYLARGVSKKNPFFGDTHGRINDIRKRVLNGGLESYSEASQNNNNLGYFSPFFTKNEKAFLIAKCLSNEPQQFYDQLLTCEIDDLFGKIINELKEHPDDFENLKTALLHEKDAKILEVLKTATLLSN